jgi:pyruvoyl-dependent arginine decarboxylase
MKFGNRIPSEYFITSGFGQSAAGSEGLPFETGSYDDALNDAGIQNVNVVKYTSVMPTNIKNIGKEAGLANIKWGEVMECIMAQQNGNQGETITATVMTTSVFDKSGKHLGGFACEYAGSGTRKDVEESLAISITGMIERRGYGTFITDKGGSGPIQMYKDNTTSEGFVIHPGKEFCFKSGEVKEAHGTVFATICFNSYDYPVISNSKGGRRKTRKKRKQKKKRK